MLVEHERKYVQWLQRNKIITDPFKTHKLQERYGKNISEKRGMLINWETKRKKKKKKEETILNLKEQKLQSRIFLWKAIPIVRAKRDYLSYNPGRLERYK